jgi:hypothetical protein
MHITHHGLEHGKQDGNLISGGEEMADELLSR